MIPPPFPSAIHKRMFNPALTLPGNTPCGQEACGMSGITPIPFQAISYSPRIFSRQASGIPGDGLFQQHGLLRSSGMSVARQGSGHKNVYSGYPGLAFSAFALGIFSPLKAVVRETRALISHLRCVCIHQNKSTYSPVLSQGRNVSRIHGSNAHRQASHSGSSSGTEPYTSPNRICDENESQSFLFRILYMGVLPMHSSTSYGAV